MTRKQKEQKIKSLVKDMLKESHIEMIKKIDKVLISGAIDVDGWDDKHNFMLLPKAIVTAILENESTQYNGSGTYFEKEQKKTVRNIKYFI